MCVDLIIGVASILLQVQGEIDSMIYFFLVFNALFYKYPDNSTEGLALRSLSNRMVSTQFPNYYNSLQNTTVIFYFYCL